MKIDLRFSFGRLGTLLFLMFAIGCEQKVVLKDYKLTGVNPVAYTDVVYKASRDTVFVSTFTGKIYEIANGETNRCLIAEIDDEIYDMVYLPANKNILLATLNSGVLVLDLQNGEISHRLSLKTTWGHELIYNAEAELLATNDFAGNVYLWNTGCEFVPVSIPAELKGMSLRKIMPGAEVYFQGKGKVAVWELEGNVIFCEEVAEGKLWDVDAKGNYLMLGGKEFLYWDTRSDSVEFRKKHPDWPIYITDEDSLVHVPLSLELLDGRITDQSIITVGLDKTLRFWEKTSGELLKTQAKHRYSIAGIDVNKDHSQMVSVDLDGKIEFLDLMD
ncbi:WD40 repeat domain-containing protein [Algoriphagus sp.]|uniref:WD40 repeat domain-containing protein n=1 Tax=Algoriphagus sp. TaxID=1872435 RepID=UPI003F6F7A72